MTHDGEYFRQRAAQARAAAFRHDDSEEDVLVAGQLALAYSALARRKAQPEEPAAAMSDEAQA